MNIYKRELKTLFKPLLLWSLGLFALLFIGMTKFTGVENAPGSVNLNDFMGKFPRIILSVFGMTDVDVTTLGGFYSIIAYYCLICAIIFSVQLGTNAVSRESIDGTYEFLFAKPRTRSFILGVKLAAAWTFLTLFVILMFLFSISSAAVYGFGSIETEMLLFSAAALLCGSVFLALSAFISAAVINTEKASLYSNLCFLFAYIMSLVYDISEKTHVVKIFSPLRYFTAPDLLEKKADPVYVIICVLLTMVFLAGAFTAFGKKDLR
ncbi:MAG: ABC transporter permease subunit [Eubacteriales bacterium]|nr:ABC transporter permease subunit [Eubacteriales bacterium]